MLDLITQVRNLALEAEQKGQKLLAARLRAVADEVEVPISADRPNWFPQVKASPESPIRAENDVDVVSFCAEAGVHGFR